MYPYGSLLIAIIFDHIPEELRIKISEKFADEDWKLDDTMNLLKNQLEARERSLAIKRTINGMLTRGFLFCKSHANWHCDGETT